MQQQETPGLGSQCQTEVTDKKLWKPFEKGGRPTSWADQFAGKNVEDLVVVKEKTDKHIEAITGATITSDAVVKAARNAITTLSSVLQKESE